MSRPRIGFLGTGWIGRHRMEKMLATGAVEAVAIADPSSDCLAEASKLAPEAAALPSLEAMVDHGVDGVVIATPSALHAAQSIAALERGVAVFCQKPLGRDAAEVRGVIEAAERADRLLGVDLSYRFTAATRAIEERLRSGELGEVFAVDLTFHNAYGPDRKWFYDREQSGGGCVIDLGVHLVDLALWLLDFPQVERITSQLYARGQLLPPSSETVEDTAFATLELANGATVRLSCSWNLHAGQDAVIGADFLCTQGALSLRNRGGSFFDFETLLHRGTSREIIAEPPDDWGGRAAADWACKLVQNNGFDPEVRRMEDVSKVLDVIYEGG